MRREEAVAVWRSGFGVRGLEFGAGGAGRDALPRDPASWSTKLGSQEVDRLAAVLFDNVFIGRTTPDRAGARPSARRRTPNAERQTPNSQPPPPSVPFRAVWRILATPNSSELLIGRNVDLVSLRRHAKSQLAISWASCMLKFTTGHF